MIKEYSEILLNHTASLKEAMKHIDKTSQKIVFIIDDQFRLIGSLSDGDIRRWILNDGSLTESVGVACFKETYFVTKGYNPELVKAEIKKREIVYVPVVNENKVISEFLIWDKLFDGNIIRKTKSELNAEVVIMAGGKGTRLDPFTKILPKPLIPIGDKSILEIIIDRFLEYRHTAFYISVNHKARIIKSYFEEIQPEYTISYIEEDIPLGTIGALKKLERSVHRDIILTNCDIIIEADYSDILDHHQKQKNDITIVASLKHYSIPYGIIEIENGGRLVGIKEKPEYDFLVNTGMYIINPDVLQYIPGNEFFHITHLIDKIQSTHNIGIYPISENSWIDTGEWVEYRKAVEMLIK